jgi:hypothetical protein
VNWREKSVIRILLLVAKIIAGNDELSQQIQHLANHISAWAPETDL